MNDNQEKRIAFGLGFIFWATLLSYVLPNIIGFVFGLANAHIKFEFVRPLTLNLGMGLRLVAFLSVCYTLASLRQRLVYPRLRFVIIILGLSCSGLIVAALFARESETLERINLVAAITDNFCIFFTAVYFSKLCSLFKFLRLTRSWRRFALLYFLFEIIFDLAIRVIEPSQIDSESKFIKIHLMFDLCGLILWIWVLKLIWSLRREIQKGLHSHPARI